MNVNPNVTRAMTVLEIAAGLGSGGARDYQPATLALGESDPLRLASKSTAPSIRDVLARRVDLAIANPSAALLQAYGGTGPFSSPQPVRLVAVLPSQDQFVFAAHARAGLRALEDIPAARIPLRLSLRGARDHCLHDVLGAVTQAAGFSFPDIESWGGRLVYEGGVPRPGSARLGACIEGRTDAVFDEGADEWLKAAIHGGLTILSLREETVRQLEAIGYRRAWLRASAYPGLPGDVLTIDFSGWPIFVHAELADERVRAICAALDSRAHLIPANGTAPLSSADMCRDTPAGPHHIPLHRAAETYWRERGYLQRPVCCSRAGRKGEGTEK